MKKIGGIVLIIVGFVLLLSNISPVKEYVYDYLPDVAHNYILGAGAVLVIVGLFFAKGKGSGRRGKGNALLPIFEGNRVVGYKKSGK